MRQELEELNEGSGNIVGRRVSVLKERDAEVGDGRTDRKQWRKQKAQMDLLTQRRRPM